MYIATVATFILFLTLLLSTPAASLGDGGTVHRPAPSPGSGESADETVSGAVELPPGVGNDWWAAVQENIWQSEYHVTWQEQTYLKDVQGFSMF